MSAEERDSFKYLLLLCLPHHAEIDDRDTGGRLYPAEKLLEWKTRREGANGPSLAALGTIGEQALENLLVDVFTPPLDRLQAIADQLEETGTLNANSVNEIRQIVDVLAQTPSGPDAQTAHNLAFAAEIFGDHNLSQTARLLNKAAGSLADARLTKAAELLSQAATDAMNAAEHIR